MTSQRKKTAPPTPRRPRSSSSSRKGLIATEKTKKQSVKKRTVLDNRFHRTPKAYVLPSGTTAASGAVRGRFMVMYRAEHSANPSQRMQ